MPSLGDLTVHLGAATTQFRKDLDGAESKLKGTATAMRSVINQAGQLGLAATAAGVAIGVGLVNKGLQFIDIQAKLARNTGSTIDGIRALQIATGDYGVEQTKLNSVLERFSGRIGEAMRESTGASAEMLQSLGLNVHELAQMDIDEQMATVADRVHELGLNAQQTGDVLRQLGIRSLEMVDVFRDGGGAIRAARTEVDEFGLSLSMVDANKVEAANDAMERIGRIMEGVTNQMAIAFAPLLKELADRFNNAAKANKGFGDQARQIAENVIMGFGKFLDVVHGIRTAFKAGELVITAFGAAVISTIQIAANAVAQFIDGIIRDVNKTIELLNELPKVDIATVDPFSDSAFIRGLNDFAEANREQVGVIREELHNLAMTEMPSAKFERFLEAVKAKAQDASVELENVRSAMDTGGAEGFGTEFDPEVEAQKAKAEAQREALAQRVQALSDSLLEEEELQQTHFQRELEMLIEANEQKILTDQEYNELRQKLEEEHIAALAEIRKRGLSDLEAFNAMSFKNQTKTVVGELANMTSGVAQHSKAMFQINKAAGIASAIVNTAEGVTKALSAYPPPVSFAMAAAQAAAGAAQIAAIKSATFGGGGGVAPSLTGAASATPVALVGNQDQQVVRVQGLDPSQLFSGRQVVDLLNSAVKDGARLEIDQ